MEQPEQEKKRKKKWSYDCNRVRKLLAIFGHRYTKKEMKKMKKISTPLYQRVLESINIFTPKIHYSTKVWKVFLIKKSHLDGTIVAEPLYTDSNVRILEEKSVSSKMIQSLSNQFLDTKMRQTGDRTKLYHLITDNHIQCIDSKKAYENDKCLSSCILLDHNTECAQFIRDNDGVKRMLHRLDKFVHFDGNFRKNISQKKKVAYCRKRIERFAQEITELIKGEEKFIKKDVIKRKEKSKKKKKKKKVIDPILTEIGMEEAMVLLEEMIVKKEE